MIIAIDFDGTIGDANLEKARWIKTHLGRDVFPWQCSATECIPIIGPEEYDRAGDCVYEREGTLRADEVPGALDALRSMAAIARLHVVTARGERRLLFAREWLEVKGVLSCIEGIHSSAGTTKEAVCSELGANVLIDDDLRHLREVKMEGLMRILLQDGRKDQADCGPGVRFCTSWRQILGCIGETG